MPRLEERKSMEGTTEEVKGWRKGGSGDWETEREMGSTIG